MDTQTKGGKPSKGTSADGRLSANKPGKAKPAKAPAAKPAPKPAFPGAKPPFKPKSQPKSQPKKG